MGKRPEMTEAEPEKVSDNSSPVKAKRAKKILINRRAQRTTTRRAPVKIPASRCPFRSSSPSSRGPRGKGTFGTTARSAVNAIGTGNIRRPELKKLNAGSEKQNPVSKAFLSRRGRNARPVARNVLQMLRGVEFFLRNIKEHCRRDWPGMRVDCYCESEGSVKKIVKTHQ